MRRKSATARKSLPPWATSPQASPMSCAIRSSSIKGVCDAYFGGRFPEAAQIGEAAGHGQKEGGASPSGHRRFIRLSRAPRTSGRA